MRITKNVISVIAIFLLLLSASLETKAQSVEFTPFSGYTLRSTFDVRGGRMRVYGGHTFGGILTYNVNPLYGIEFMYSRQSTKADANSRFLTDSDVPVAVVYTMLGGIRQFPVSEKVIPFAGVNFGAAGLVPQVPRYDDSWRFAVGVKAGTKLMITDLLGLRLQAVMNVPIEGFGSSFFIGTGGSGASLNSYSGIFQFTFTGGLVFHLGL